MIPVVVDHKEKESQTPGLDFGSTKERSSDGRGSLEKGMDKIDAHRKSEPEVRTHHSASALSVEAGFGFDFRCNPVTLYEPTIQGK